MTWLWILLGVLGGLVVGGLVVLIWIANDFRDGIGRSL